MAATTNNMDSPAYRYGHAELRCLERAGNLVQEDLRCLVITAGLGGGRQHARGHRAQQEDGKCGRVPGWNRGPTQRAVQPPSIAIADPVIEVAKSPQRKSRSAAISAGGTNRLFG